MDLSQPEGMNPRHRKCIEQTIEDLVRRIPPSVRSDVADDLWIVGCGLSRQYDHALGVSIEKYYSDNLAKRMPNAISAETSMDAEQKQNLPPVDPVCKRIMSNIIEAFTNKRPKRDRDDFANQLWDHAMRLYHDYDPSKNESFPIYIADHLKLRQINAAREIKNITSCGHRTCPWILNTDLVEDDLLDSVRRRGDRTVTGKAMFEASKYAVNHKLVDTETESLLRILEADIRTHSDAKMCDWCGQPAMVDVKDAPFCYSCFKQRIKFEDEKLVLENKARYKSKRLPDLDTMLSAVTPLTWETKEAFCQTPPNDRAKKAGSTPVTLASSSALAT